MNVRAAQRIHHARRFNLRASALSLPLRATMMSSWAVSSSCAIAPVGLTLVEELKKSKKQFCQRLGKAKAEFCQGLVALALSLQRPSTKEILNKVDSSAYAPRKIKYRVNSSLSKLLENSNKSRTWHKLCYFLRCSEVLTLTIKVAGLPSQSWGKIPVSYHAVLFLNALRRQRDRRKMTRKQQAKQAKQAGSHRK